MKYFTRFCYSALLMVLLLTGEATGSQQTTPKHILAIFTQAPGLPVYDAILQRIRTTLRAGLDAPVNLYTEYLDAPRFPHERDIQRHFDLMRYRYKDLKIDLLLAIGPDILPLISKHGRDNFDSLPTVFGEMQYHIPDITPITRKPNSTGVIGFYPFKEVVEVALRAQPDTTDIFVIAGSSPDNQLYEKQAQATQKDYENKVRFTYISGLSLEETAKKASELPPKSIAVFLNIRKDSTGKMYIPLEALRVILKSSNRPVYSDWDTYVGHGVVGGCVLSAERIGDRLGDLALKILQGAHPDSLPVVQEGLTLHMFDWRELKRWGISEKDLPSGSVVKYQEFSFWDLYKWYIIAGILFMIIEALLLGVLTILLRNQRGIQARLREAEFLYRTVADFGYDWEYWLNPDKTLRYVSPSVERITGYTSQQLMNDPALRWKIIVPEDMEIWGKHLEDEDHLSKPLEVQFRIRRKDGAVRWIEHACQSVAGPNGESRGIRVSNRDITERKKGEQLVLESEQRFREFFENVPEYCYIISPEGIILDINQVALKTLGYERKEIVGKPLNMIYAQQSLPQLKQLFDKFIETGFLYNEEMIVATKTGEARSVILNATAVRDSEGKIRHSVSIQTDVTARKQTEAEIHQARGELLRVERISRLGELVASLSHELNQPLAAILSTAQAGLRFLNSEAPDLDLLRTVLQNIVQDDKRAAGVITGLRSMVKKEEREGEQISLNDVLRDVLSLFRSEAIIRDVKIETELADPLPLVYGDRVQLQQVVINLLMNAAEAMMEIPRNERRIALCTQATDRGIQVVVRDFGLGIDPARLDDIWRPFFTTKDKGLGMGLSVSKSIVQTHRGLIWAENNPHGGAMFAFVIPAVDEEKL